MSVEPSQPRSAAEVLAIALGTAPAAPPPDETSDVGPSTDERDRPPAAGDTR